MTEPNTDNEDPEVLSNRHSQADLPMFSGEEEIKNEESDGEATELPEGDDITYEVGTDTYDRENELAHRLENCHEKL